MADLPHVSDGDVHAPIHNAERDVINALQQAMPTKITKPNSPGLGTVLRWDGDNYVPSAMRLFEGGGSPEGVVSAPPGSTYIDVNATNGITNWTKASGAGNTGWISQFSSLPWTNINLGTGFIHTTGGWTAQASMVNGVVYLRGAVRRTGGTGTVVGTLPDGMHPGFYTRGYIRAGINMITFDISDSGQMNISASLVSNSDIFLGSAAQAPFRVN